MMLELGYVPFVSPRVVLSASFSYTPLLETNSPKNFRENDGKDDLTPPDDNVTDQR